MKLFVKRLEADTLKDLQDFKTILSSKREVSKGLSAHGSLSATN
jgi:hypothetical protein